MKLFIKYFSTFIFLIFFSSNVYSQDVPYVPTPYVVVEGMLDMAEVTSDDVVYDLGCGDGRIVVTAAKNYGARGVGVDSNPTRIKESKQNANENEVTDKVEFYEKNLFDTDLTDATVVAIYLLSDVNIRLRPKLFEELKPGSRVVSNSFDMDEWEPEERRVVGERNIYLWVIPENFSGIWEGKITGNDSEENFELQLNQQFQKVNGTLHLGDEQYKITEVTHIGKQLNFKADKNIEQGNILLRFEGTLEGNNLNGTISSYNGESVNKQTITAIRDLNTILPLDPALQKDIHVKGQ